MYRLYIGHSLYVIHFSKLNYNDLYKSPSIFNLKVEEYER